MAAPKDLPKDPREDAKRLALIVTGGAASDNEFAIVDEIVKKLDADTPREPLLPDETAVFLPITTLRQLEQYRADRKAGSQPSNGFLFRLHLDVGRSRILAEIVPAGSQSTIGADLRTRADVVVSRNPHLDAPSRSHTSTVIANIVTHALKDLEWKKGPRRVLAQLSSRGYGPEVA